MGTKKEIVCVVTSSGNIYTSGKAEFSCGTATRTIAYGEMHRDTLGFDITDVPENGSSTYVTFVPMDKVESIRTKISNH
jgi:hypothetical protein